MSKPGLPSAAVRPGLRLFGRWAFSPRVDWPTTRRRLALGLRLPPPPRGTSVRPLVLGGVPVEELTAPGTAAQPVLVYFHGGGYTTGGPDTHRPLVARLGRAFGGRALLVRYRLAPEHPFPAGLEDARAAWDALTEQEGVPPEHVVVAGDSAGAGLTLALALSLRDAGRPLPAALGLVCPWLDLTEAGVAARPAAPREPLLSTGLLRRFARAYLAGGTDPADPLVSPLHADLSGLPAIVVQTASDDLIAGDGRALAERARAAGVPVEHEELAGVWHDVHLSAPLIAGTVGEAPDRLAAALRARVGAAALGGPSANGRARVAQG